MINDADCETSLPIATDDQQIPSTGSWNLRDSSQPASILPAIFEVVAAISKVLEALREQSIPTGTLQSCESVFSNCISAFPARHQLRSNDYLHPYELAPLVYLQSARLMLHRHNLTPLCASDERTAAIDRCCIVAQDTVRLLNRCMQDPSIASPNSPSSASKQDSWEPHLKSAATAFLSTHLWRCVLVLSFRGFYEAALVCARASTIIGDARPVNVACGRYLDFYLRQLTARLQQGEGAYLESDEEMMAYMSGDLQGRTEAAWVWQGSENEDCASPNPQSPLHADHGHSMRSSGLASMREGIIEWSGWRGILETLSRLAQEQDPQNHSVQAPEGFNSPQQSDSGPLVASGKSQHSKVTPLNPNRISIADII